MFTTFQRFGILARGQTIRSCLVRLPIIQMGFHLLSEVGLVLNDARDHQRRPALASNLDCQMNTLVRVNPAEEDQVVTARFFCSGYNERSIPLYTVPR